MQIFFLLVFFIYLLFLQQTDLSFAVRRYVSLVLCHLYRLFYMYSFPILSLLYFLMFSDTVVNRFIVDGRPRSRNFNSIASYVLKMIYTMHSRSHVHACSAT